MNKEI